MCLSIVALRDNRIELIRASWKELTISISEVALSDEGQYTCSLFTMPIKTSKAFLTVLGKCCHRSYTFLHKSASVNSSWPWWSLWIPGGSIPLAAAGTDMKEREYFIFLDGATCCAVVVVFLMFYINLATWSITWSVFVINPVGVGLWLPFLGCTINSQDNIHF